MTNHRRSRLSPLLAGLLAGLTFAAPAVQAAMPGPATPVAGLPAAPVTITAQPAPETIRPSIQVEEAAAHAGDRIDFVPGGKVEVGFRPRAGDTWPVGGRAPRALPSGNASGQEIHDSRQGSTWAVRQPTAAVPGGSVLAPVDGAGLAPGAIVQGSSTAAVPAATPDPLSPGGTGLFRQVFGFLPYWELTDSSTTLRYDLLSTIAYFGVGADGAGNLIKTNVDGTTSTGWGGWASSKLTSVISAAHLAGTRVVLTVQSFGWTSSQAANQAALLSSPDARLNLARQTAAAVRDRGADGINLDFEPIVSGHADEFTALVRTIRAELDAIAPGYQLTFDTTGWIGNYPIADATAPGGADAIFIMGYDYRTSGASTAGSVSPLTGPVYDLTETIAAYTARVSPGKLILGVPYYGRAWSTDSDAVRATNISSSTNGTSVAVMYTTAIDFANTYGRRWDDAEQTPWTAYQKTTCNPGCVTTWRELYYDDPESLGDKYDFINRSGLRGVGIWALGYDNDRPELYAVLAAKFQHDTTAPQAGIVAMASVTPTRDIPVTWKGVDDRGVAGYDVQVSTDGADWVPWITGTSATSASYAGAAGHGFAFRVRATDTSGNVGAWGIDSRWSASPALAPGGFGKVVATTVNLRSGPTTGAGIVGTATAGTLVAVTGGPVSSDGYTWFKISLPVTEWGPTSSLISDVWIAAGSASTAFVAAAQAPNATTVDLAAPAPGGARYTGITPARLLDTRMGNGLAGTFASGAVRAFQVTGRDGIPSNATAVTGNLTITESTSDGWITIGPSVDSMPATSTLNAPRGDNRAAGVTVALATDGTLSAVFQGAPGSTTHLIFDVSGYFVAGTSGATFVPIEPVRLLDSRFGNGLAGQFANQVPRGFQISGRGGVPDRAVAVTANVTITRQTTAGYVALGPTVSSSPSTSVLNAPRSDDRANGVTVPLGPGGTLQAVWLGDYLSRTDLIVDITGYFVNDGTGASYHALVPVRLLDSRMANGLSGAFQQMTPRTVEIGGRGTIPVDALAVTGTLTITQQTSAGFLAMTPVATGNPGTSTLNAPAGDNRANGATVRLGPGSSVGIVWSGNTGSTAHVIFDATGYFQ